MESSVMDYHLSKYGGPRHMCWLTLSNFGITRILGGGHMRNCGYQEGVLNPKPTALQINLSQSFSERIKLHL